MSTTLLTSQGVAGIVPGDQCNIRIANLRERPVRLKKRQVVARACLLVDFVHLVDGDVEWSAGIRNPPRSTQQTSDRSSVAFPSVEIDVTSAPGGVKVRDGYRRHQIGRGDHMGGITSTIPCNNIDSNSSPPFVHFPTCGGGSSASSRGSNFESTSCRSPYPRYEIRIAIVPTSSKSSVRR